MRRTLHEWSARSIGRFFAPPLERRVAILCYHSIHPTISFSLHPEIFEAHLRWLTANCDVVRFGQLVPGHCDEGSRPEVAITFDDGYLDNYEIALPLLLKYKVTATFFLTPGFLLKRQEVVDHLAAGWRAPASEITPMIWSHAENLLAAGMDIGAHSFSHIALSRLDETSAMAELSDSKRVLETTLGIPVAAMSYPYGRPGSAVRPETIRLAAEAGYTRAALVLFRGVRSADSLLELPRFVADDDSVESLSEKIRGWWDPIGIFREHWARLATR